MDNNNLSEGLMINGETKNNMFSVTQNRNVEQGRRTTGREITVSSLTETDPQSLNFTISGLVTVDKTMWILILLISHLPVSGAVWGKRFVRGVLGRAITIECHYSTVHRSHAKYWCGGRTRQCTVLVETNGQHGRNGRVSITDNPTRGIFTVTVADLHSEDKGWYNCGINTPGKDPLFQVQLQVSDEPVSVPGLLFLSPTNVSCTYGSVSLSCESVQGSLPIQYTWYERTTSMDSKISDNSHLDLHCRSFKHQHLQYYCTASNNRGTGSSEMVNVTVITRVVNCHYVTVIKGLSLGSQSLYFNELANRITPDVDQECPICNAATCRLYAQSLTLIVNESDGPRVWTGNAVGGLYRGAAVSMPSGSTHGRPRRGPAGASRVEAQVGRSGKRAGLGTTET
ncbi:uncharacterized protein LOC144605233 [Rhinoraja longicauda]